MTVPTQVSVYSQVFVPRDYDVFAGLDVDHHRIVATFTDHDRLMQSLRLPYSVPQLGAAITSNSRFNLRSVKRQWIDSLCSSTAGA